MIRRFSVAVAAVVLAGTIASGCSTFTKNNNAAEAGGAKLSIDDFESIAQDLATAGNITPPTNGEFDGTTTRSLLTRWVNAHLLEHALDAAGTPITDATRAAAETQIMGLAGDRWAPLQPVTKSFLIEEIAAVDGVISDAEAEAAYNAGLATSNTLCLRIIAAPDQATAQSISKQLQDGSDFATLADANNTGGFGKGGVFTNSTTKSECSSASSLNTQVAQAVESVPLDKPTAPIAITGQGGTDLYFIMLQRPWKEIATTAGGIIRQAIAPAKAKSLVTGGKAVIDSRYGMWDSATLNVVAAR